MSAAHGNEPAFPVNELNQTTGDICAQHFGMTLRDHFAGLAMQAWLSTFLESQHPANNGRAADVANASYVLADAMLEARK